MALISQTAVSRTEGAQEGASVLVLFGHGPGDCSGPSGPNGQGRRALAPLTAGYRNPLAKWLQEAPVNLRPQKPAFAWLLLRFRFLEWRFEK